MRSIVFFLLLIFLTSACGILVGHAGSAPTNSTDSSIKPYVFVGGGVQNPGRYNWFPGMTVGDAIAAAGGFTDPSEQHVLILHLDGTRESFNADTFSHGVKKPPMLRAGDHISVPKKIL